MSLFRLVLFVWMIAAGVSLFAAERTGEVVYREMCASCHGANGEGTPKEYPEPLLGDKSVKELAIVIAKTMPENKPQKCSREDAELVAAYIHNAFYSPLAQARIKPARVALSRLTVRQYRESIADLFAEFRPSEQPNGERGLRGNYFPSRRTRDREKIVDRIDPVVQFDFNEGKPVEDDRLKSDEFTINWNGSVFAPETGNYEFVVKTANGMRLWVNDDDVPLIDGSVRSGNDVEHRESRFLLGGRYYPLRLEFFKSNKAKEKKAAIALHWTRPNHTTELIDTRYLSPHQSRETLIVSTVFPADDRSVGYERGTSISKEWDQATTDAALEVAAVLTRKVNGLAGTKNDAGDRKQKIQDFTLQLAGRAFRRPLNEETQAPFVKQFADNADIDTAFQRCLLLMLKSPRFLYREVEGATTDPWNIASRIAFTLWDSLPDKPLREAAANGQLTTREQVRSQVERMAADPRGQTKLNTFLRQWTRMDALIDIAKDSKLYPEFDHATVSDLRTSLELALADVSAQPQATYRQLILDDRLYLNGRLVTLYGMDRPTDALFPANAPFRKVKLEGETRFGVVTHPFLMAGLAYTATSSPIHRGVYLSRTVLGRSLKPPPEAIAPILEDLHPDLTTRERVVLQTKAEVCQGCHVMINSLGFTLENFDAIGRWRKEEKGKLIDDTGRYITREGEEKTLQGPRDLATFLADSPESRQAFVQQLFHFLVKQPIRAFGADVPAALGRSFLQNDQQIRMLAIEITTTVAAAGLN